MSDVELWERALDELAATLDRQQAHLDLVRSGDVDAVPPAPFTADLPPLPPSCVPRARALLLRLEALAAAVEEGSSEVRPRRTARLPRFAPARSASTFVRTA